MRFGARAVAGWPFPAFTIMFTTYAAEGTKVGATPDGRRAGEPLADSIGPVTGRDRNGPTAMLRSVTRLPLHLATGTPVLNIRFAKRMFSSQEGRRAIRDLITTYFEMGGMQIQLTIVDREILEDAIVHPELHEDLIVRVGGFSAYFNSLSPALQQAILERTSIRLALNGAGRTRPSSGIWLQFFPVQRHTKSKVILAIGHSGFQPGSAAAEARRVMPTTTTQDAGIFVWCQTCPFVGAPE